MDKFFGLKRAGTSIKTEILAGATTFFTMVYIIFVNPGILQEAGMSWNGVFVATILATVVGTLVMGLVANVPYAAAPGMGLNAFFTYTVCKSLQFDWREALAMVFICGVINVIVTVTKARKHLIMAIPRGLQLATSGAIGLFISYIGLKNAGFITFVIPAGASGAAPGADVTPVLAPFDGAGSILAAIGLLITIILVIKDVKGAIFIGVVLTTVIGIPMGVTQIPDKLFDLSALGGIKDVSFAFFGSPGLGSMFSNREMIPLVLITIFALSLSDTFDTIGAFIGTGRKCGIFDDEGVKALSSGSGIKTGLEKALFADSTATVFGALLGTSNTTTYLESAAGISSGGRTGLTSVVVAALFLLCLPFAALFAMVPLEATAPALFVVGIMMIDAFAGIKWNQLEEALPAFFIVAVMIFCYNISYGIAFGFIFYCVTKICKNKAREIHPIIYGTSLLFILNFILLAVNNTNPQ